MKRTSGLKMLILSDGNRILALATINLVMFTRNCNAHVDSTKLQEECKIADICRHDQVPLCGIDSCGEMRTFIDSCDMHEFNCDSKKDFVQRPVHECWVTCKRGRSFKKPEFRADCDIKSNMV